MQEVVSLPTLCLFFSDSFSGSTAHAALLSFRNCVSVEVDARQYGGIVTRLENKTFDDLTRAASNEQPQIRESEGEEDNEEQE